MPPVIGVIMGSRSDWETMQHVVEVLDKLKVASEVKVVSAHRTPDLLRDYSTSAEGRGLKVIIAGAGGAAHLPGMVSAWTILPVLGVPIESKTLKGMDSLLSIVQMPGGVPAASELALSRDRTPQEYRETLGEISDKCDHFRLLINQLLLLAETEAGANLPHHVIQMDRIIEKSYAMFKDVASQQQIHFKLDSTSPALVLGEAKQIQQVVNNLIDNALKFTPEGGTIVVELFKEASKIVLNVSDTGVGISKEDQSKVFDRFFQADRSHTKNTEALGGNGLGLSICKAIVESMGGTIAVTSTLEKGSTFTITLPLIGPV